MQLSNSEAIKHAAAAGLGLACLSRMIVAQPLASGELIEMKSEKGEAHRLGVITLPSFYADFDEGKVRCSVDVERIRQGFARLLKDPPSRLADHPAFATKPR